MTNTMNSTLKLDDTVDVRSSWVTGNLAQACIGALDTAPARGSRVLPADPAPGATTLPWAFERYVYDELARLRTLARRKPGGVLDPHYSEVNAGTNPRWTGETYDGEVVACVLVRAAHDALGEAAEEGDGLDELLGGHRFAEARRTFSAAFGVDLYDPSDPYGIVDEDWLHAQGPRVAAALAAAVVASVADERRGLDSYELGLIAEDEQR